MNLFNFLKKTINLLETPFLFSHELCHYVVARLLGFEVQLHLRNVWIRPRPGGWTNIAITTAPILFGWVIWLYFAWWSYQRELYGLVVLCFLTNLYWQNACRGDYLEFWRIFKNNGRQWKMKRVIRPMMFHHYRTTRLTLAKQQDENVLAKDTAPTGNKDDGD
jgi:hypothetical protein